MEIISYMTFGDLVRHPPNNSIVLALQTVVRSNLIESWAGSSEMGQAR